MALTLKIENETSLPDGGPLSVSIKGQRGIDIGRDQYLDWTLPDPSRFISGKHCEVRWHDGAYWLHDISTNGTFLHGSDSRLKAPHKLRDGDRFAVGHYIILATIDEESGRAEDPRPRAAPPSYDELWNPVAEAAPPIDPKELKAARDLRPVRADFLDWAVDVPPAHSAPPSYVPPTPASPPQRSGSSRQERAGAPPWETPRPAPREDDWAQGPARPMPPEPEPIAVPSPRRPVWVTGEPNGPWAGQPSAGTTPPASPAAAANVLAAAQALAATATGAAPPPSAGRAASEPARSMPPRERAVPSPGGAADAVATAELIRLIARGAGLPDDALAGRHPGELAEQIGALLRLATENVKQLLDARQQAKRLARSANQTMIQALNNNPLKFAPSADDALRIMFGPPTRSYLDAQRAFAQSFDDLKAHQLQTFSAMQHALKLLLGEFDPDVIENALTGDRGLAGVVGSRKARLWDLYVARWQARTQSNQDGMLNAFMDYFAECYDRD
jgi:type VI secretion system protein ImpI